ncbi:MAG TPA: surface-adhesin E family protein [Nitrospiraceae bacterium]|nr:surface-adhesin E family protein [Nitrospiraceae bacterium]
MTRLILIMLLVLSGGAAYAEWVEVSANKMAGVIAYADPDTIHRKGDLVKMWSLFDLKTTQTVGGNSYLSIKAQQTYDCAEDRSRALAYTKFSGNMGHGAEVYSGSVEQKWNPVTPMSVGQELWKVACGKK